MEHSFQFLGKNVVFRKCGRFRKKVACFLEKKGIDVVESSMILRVAGQIIKAVIGLSIKTYL